MNAAAIPANYQESSPEHVFTSGVAWVGERFEIGGDLRYARETLQYGRGATLSGLFPVDAYVQANARVAWEMNDVVQLELSGRNLLDSQTQTVGLRPQLSSVSISRCAPGSEGIDVLWNAAPAFG